MSPLDAAFNVAHDYPGGASALAHRMGKHEATLSHELKHSGSAKLGLMDALRISLLTGSPAIAQAFAGACGGVYLPLAPDALEQGGDLAALGASIREFGEFASSFAASLADGRVTGNELRDMEREALDAIGAITQALALAKANHEAGKPAHERAAGAAAGLGAAVSISRLDKAAGRRAA